MGIKAKIFFIFITFFIFQVKTDIRDEVERCSAYNDNKTACIDNYGLIMVPLDNGRCCWQQDPNDPEKGSKIISFNLFYRLYFC
ncbi:MAG: hypothetical protein MJ252_10890 [archaeon]|nr:hypothetical protein [archaeon]